MSDLSAALPPRGRGFDPGRALRRLAASPRFQSAAARTPILRRLVRSEGQAMFDLVAGFVHAQVLAALSELDLIRPLVEAPATARALAAGAGMDERRMEVLLRAGTAVGLLRRRRDGRFVATHRGAALSAVPGLTELIRHHRILYRDLSDPVAFFRGGTETELARLWPYVLGGEVGEEEAARYSALMTGSQALVADEVLAAVSFRGVRRLMDVGGGSGAFLIRALEATPGLSGTLVDLPSVTAVARARLAQAGLADRVRIEPLDMQSDPLPMGADAVSLIRVLYDHPDDAVRALLDRVHAALPPGGRVIVAEPMTGGARPTRAGDAYFAIYTMAMRTGRARSADEIAQLLRGAGFGRVRSHRTGRPFVTGVVSAARID